MHIVCRSAAGFVKRWGDKKDAMRRRRTRKRLIVTASRREGVYDRAGEPSVSVCGKGGTVERVTDFL